MRKVVIFSTKRNEDLEVGPVDATFMNYQRTINHVEYTLKVIIFYWLLEYERDIDDRINSINFLCVCRSFPARVPETFHIIGPDTKSNAPSYVAGNGRKNIKWDLKRSSVIRAK